MTHAATFFTSSAMGRRMTRRYDALDSWRGICALLVALFHFQGVAFSHLSGSMLIRHSYLFVDFFFVLSGFVIAGNYGVRLGRLAEVKQFVWLRLGRIYPLHLFLLSVLVLMELGRLLARHGHGEGLFTGVQNGYAIITHLLLLQGFPLHDRLTWNFPSWTIGVEFYTYLVFALVCWLGGSRRWLAALVTGVVAMLALSVTPAPLDTHVAFDGIFRCIYGFMTGALCWHLVEYLGDGSKPVTPAGTTLATALELLVVVGVVLFVSMAQRNNWFVLNAPLLFAVAVLVFAREAGWISRGLRTPWMLRLGLWSYSIYMVHALVQLMLHALTHKVTHGLGLDLFRPAPNPDEPLIFGVARWQGDALTAAMIAFVLAISALTYRFIEAPGRDWFKRHQPSGRHRRPAPAPQVSPVATETLNDARQR